MFLQIEIDETDYSLEVDQVKTKFNFIVKKSRSELTVRLSTSGMSVSMYENGHSWSISVPHTYQNQVNGLCGTCSSETSFGTEVEVSLVI